MGKATCLVRKPSPPKKKKRIGNIPGATEQTEPRKHRLVSPPRLTRLPRRSGLALRRGGPLKPRVQRRQVGAPPEGGVPGQPTPQLGSDPPLKIYFTFSGLHGRLPLNTTKKKRAKFGRLGPRRDLTRSNMSKQTGAVEKQAQNGGQGRLTGAKRCISPSAAQSVPETSHFLTKYWLFATNMDFAKCMPGAIWQLGSKSDSHELAQTSMGL